MAQANDSVTVTPGTGASIATHLANGKEHQVVMLASGSGHIEGTLGTYHLAVPPQATGANKLHFTLWNGSAANVLKVRGIWVVPAMDVAVTGAVAVRMDWFRTSSAGLLGTVATYDSATIGPNITPKDTSNAALPSGVEARIVPTTAPNLAAWLFQTYHHTEESATTQAALSQFNNVLPNPDRTEQELILNPGQGLLGRQGAVAGVGSVGFLVSFTVE